MSAASDREEAQRRRAEARQRRRGESEERPQPEPGASANGSDDTPGDEHGASHSSESLRNTAKVAAAGAAVGAAIGAARAFTGRGDEREAGSEGERGETHHTDRDDGAADRGPEPSASTADADEDESVATDEAAEDTDDAPPVESGTPSRDEHDRLEGTSPDETMEVVGRAREQLTALQGREPESISSLERTPSGWTATFEVVELERVPDSTDVLASYEVVLDERKNVTRYARVRRYYRSQADREGGA